MHTLIIPLVLATSAIGSPVIASAHTERATDDTPFRLEAYIDGVDTMTLFSAGDAAYLGDYTLVGGEAAPVIFTATDQGAWLGSPDASALSDSRNLPAWSDRALSVPADVSSSARGVGLVDPASSNDTNRVTTGFDVYGNYAMLVSSAGAAEQLWYAVPSGTQGVYALRWDSSSDDTAGQVVVTLRTASTL